MALTLSGTSGIVGAGIGTIGPSGANVTGVVTCTSVVSSGAVSGTTGSFTGNLTISNVEPTLNLTDSNNNSDFAVRNNDGTFGIRDTTNGVERFTISSDGTVATGGNINISGVTTAKSFVPTEGQLSNRNLIINGAMNVAQRGTTSGTEGFSTIDRFSNEEGSCDEVPTQSQHDLTSSDTGPWAEGFRHSFHIQNGNQTSGAQAANFIKLSYQVEAQDLAQSGWNYTSTSSYITLSFWVKSSVAQNFYGRLATSDGTILNYPFETGSLSANTWTKITKTIPGNANITINNDTGSGLLLEWMTYRGGNTTSPSVSLNTWATYASGTRTPDQTSTWFTTNDATWELTGVQLEVGSVATPFEHRSYGDELAKCQRYCYVVADGASNALGLATMYQSDHMFGQVIFPVTMRATPTLSATSGTNYYEFVRNGAADWFNSLSLDNRTTNKIAEIYNDTEVSGTVGHTGFIRTDNAAVKVIFNAEL